MTEREALEMALEVLERVSAVDDDCDILTHSLYVAVVEAIDFAKETLAQPEQEPVAVVGTDVGGAHLMYGEKYLGQVPDKKTAIFFKDVPVGTALYAKE